MANKTTESKTMTIEEFLKEQEDIHDVQAKVMEWVATDDLYQMVNKRKIEDEEKKLALEVDYTVVGYGDVALNGCSKALRDVSNTRACFMIMYSF